MKAERKQAQRDLSKRLKIGPKDLPSVCLYNVLNHQGVCSGEISEDSTLAYLGLANSGVSVHALSPKALRPLKSLSELQLLDKEADDVETSMLDDAAAQSTVRISGHSGPVTGVSGSADKRLLLSASLDGTLRLSSLHLWTNLAVYRLAGFPFWDVAFCSRGYYFASGGADKLGLLWTTDRMQPLRLLAGHYADVNAVEWHPNCNYVATASADRSVRVFDLLNGNAVRHLVGHRSSVETLRWSPDGRYLASGSADGAILVWDIATGRLFASAARPLIPAPVASLAFSRDGGVLAHGGRDRAVSLLSLACPDPMRGSGEAAVASEAPGSSLASFPTKATPIVNLHWTRKNVLLGLGAFETTAS